MKGQVESEHNWGRHQGRGEEQPAYYLIAGGTSLRKSWNYRSLIKGNKKDEGARKRLQHVARCSPLFYRPCDGLSEGAPNSSFRKYQVGFPNARVVPTNWFCLNPPNISIWHHQKSHFYKYLACSLWTKLIFITRFIDNYSDFLVQRVGSTLELL